MNFDSSQDTNSTEGNIFCLGKSPAHKCCLNKKCKKSAFLCKSKKCNCKKEHIKCNKNQRISIQRLHQLVNEKFLFEENIQKKIQKRIQICHSRLNDIQTLISKWSSDECDKRTKDLREKFLNTVKNGGSSTLVGQQIGTIFQLSRDVEPHVIEISDLQMTVNQALQSVETYMRKLEVVIKESLQFKGEQILSISKIVQNQEEFIKIKKELAQSGQQVQRLNLLYRGSENDFSALGFHKTCDGKSNILVLAQNDNGIRTGAYTPLAWDSGGEQKRDKSGRSFIFNLTNNLKYNLNPDLPTIYCGQNIGPNFGRLPDFELVDRCNKKFSKWRRDKLKKYHSPNISDSQFIKKMTGNQDGSPFYKIVQYEVWKVESASQKQVIPY